MVMMVIWAWSERKSVGWILALSQVSSGLHTSAVDRDLAAGVWILELHRESNCGVDAEFRLGLDEYGYYQGSAGWEHGHGGALAFAHSGKDLLPEEPHLFDVGEPGEQEFRDPDGAIVEYRLH